ncbi:DNA-binding NarL/FixJ family response regulator [Kutzneria buriramensis]|uniref:DNA-binding NarL/FixJ family response regulator n=2 Tax=Kutzneria buriramensis TaxID=1045776 RepID=A0A3E0I0D6_9PSEU|nr:DNA-binding NarL/FixJ family response regulator [Kutzneria buriramensis]
MRPGSPKGHLGHTARRMWARLMGRQGNLVLNTMTRTAVLVCATDPILRGGIVLALRGRPEIQLVDDANAEPARTVALAVGDRFDERVMALLRRMRARGYRRIVLLAGAIDDNEVLAAVQSGVCSVARRSQIDADALVRLINSAQAGEGSMPPDLLGRLLDRVGRLQTKVLEPRGLKMSGISARETDVLRLIAQGLSTREIAKKLCYSERTVKSLLHDVTVRFELRNRSHAVAFAVREGLI